MLTLKELAERQEERVQQKLREVVSLMTQTNPVLDDMMFLEPKRLPWWKRIWQWLGDRLITVGCAMSGRSEQAFD